MFSNGINNNNQLDTTPVQQTKKFPREINVLDKFSNLNIFRRKHTYNVDLQTKTASIIHNENTANELTSKEKQNILNNARKAQYIDGLQAELATALFHPNLHKAILSTQQFETKIDSSDIYPIRCTNRENNTAKIDNFITPELFTQLDAKNNAKFDEFYRAFKQTSFFMDNIQRPYVQQMSFGKNVWKYNTYRDKQRSEADKQRTKDLLKTIYKFCDQNPKEAYEFLPNFIKQFHASGNSLIEIPFNLFQKTQSPILGQVLLNPNFTEDSVSVFIDQDHTMYTSVDSCLKPFDKIERQYHNVFKGLTGHELTDHDFIVAHVETKVDLSNKVHPNESDVAKDIQSSVYIRVGNFTDHITPIG